MDYTPKQLEAINVIDKNLQIIACAGSGKTQVISERVISILKSKPEIAPKNIMAFTYTDKAAGELKNCILKLCRAQLGNIRGIAEMYVGTIHSWCLKIALIRPLSQVRFLPPPLLNFSFVSSYYVLYARH